MPEVKILYNKTGKIINHKYNLTREKKAYIKQLKKAEKYTNLAKISFRKGAYEKSFNYLYGIGAPACIIMHALPPRYNLPFPSLRMLDSVRIIDKKHGTHVYDITKQIYELNNTNTKQILHHFEKAFTLMHLIKKRENPKAKSLGFFDKLKIEYAMKCFKETYEHHPFVYAHRFVIECLTEWAFYGKAKPTERKKLRECLFKSLGMTYICRDLIKQKLELFEDLIKEAKKLK